MSAPDLVAWWMLFLRIGCIAVTPPVRAVRNTRAGQLAAFRPATLLQQAN